MKVIVTNSYDESCAYAAKLIGDLLKRKPSCKIGLATGSTPIPIYRKLIDANKTHEISFKLAHTVNLDEYCGIPASHEQSYRYFMNTNLFNQTDIDIGNTFVALGTGDFKANAAELERQVHLGGAPDLQLLGIGNNGHIAFNESADVLHAKAHIEKLTESTISANSRFFDSKDDVPTMAVTMGMGDILAAKRILLVATGAAKAEAVRGLILNDEITTRNPATLLKLHNNVTVIIDKELADAVGYTPGKTECR